MDQKTKDFNYIGSVNAWPMEDFTHPKYGKMARVIEPKVLVGCRAAGHQHEGYSTRTGYHKTWCSTCRIWWDMDSGD